MTKNKVLVVSLITDTERIRPRLKLKVSFSLRAMRHVPEGFDTFEKIQLSPDDDYDDAAGLGSLPVLTSSPRLLKSPQQQLRHHMPMAESDSQGKIPGEEGVEGGDEEDEEEVERSERHTDMPNGFVSSDSTCNEVPNFIPAADVRRPEQQPSCGSACDPSEHTRDELHSEPVCSAVPYESDGSSSDPNYSSEFEMKEQFNRVLKELNLFFDISRSDAASDSSPPSPERCCDVPETFTAKTSTCTEHLSSPELGHRNTDEADEDHSMEMCGGDPVVSLTAVRSAGEQEVPLDRYPSWEASKDTAEKDREPRDMHQKGKTWSPSFMCLPLLEQLVQRPPEQPRRLEPLKTCTRPIRVGLSKRAKTKHLHRSHPYK
ncbi:uncharacterized protein PAE49_001769 [Odontesthes bonariensis]|uniref:uncharacterized protein LOC142375676 n=1 Tax=Odontesthes bonariensis TaxID=219752 RepID=UPI003F58A875